MLEGGERGAHVSDGIQGRGFEVIFLPERVYHHSLMIDCRLVVCDGTDDVGCIDGHWDDMKVGGFLLELLQGRWFAFDSMEHSL
jgi:hypothetical protein